MIPQCPFCDVEMVPRSGPLDAYYKIYECHSCAAELKQIVARVTHPDSGNLLDKTPQPAAQPACSDCFTSELVCHQCGDPICQEHARTVTRYASVFSEPLRDQLLQEHGHLLYCAACVQLIFNRLGYPSGGKSDHKERRIFNLPIILSLLLVTLLMIFGVQQCGAADSLREGVVSLGNATNTQR